jgi:hypothetical protein
VQIDPQLKQLVDLAPLFRNKGIDALGYRPRVALSKGFVVALDLRQLRPAAL